MWTPQFTAPPRHWIHAIKIIIFIWGHHSPWSIFLEISNNRSVELNLAHNQQRYIPTSFLIPEFVDMRYGTKIRTIHH
jgi:hypothetical protein